MNLRHHKRNKVAAMIAMRGILQPTFSAAALDKIATALALRARGTMEIEAAEVEQLKEALLPPVKFNVVRKKDGISIGEFDTLEEANEAIAKAKAAKRAALVLG